MKVTQIRGELRAQSKILDGPFFAKVVNCLRMLTTCVTGSIVDVWLGSEHASIHKRNLHIKLHYGKSFHKRPGRLLEGGA